MGDSGENHEVFGTKGTLGVKVRVVWAVYSDELTVLNTPRMTGRGSGVGEKKRTRRMALQRRVTWTVPQGMRLCVEYGGG